MLILDLVSWWYGAGWLLLARRMGAMIGGLLDTFSIGTLLSTLFSPFRQISVGQTNGSLDAQLRAWLDLLISRLIGGMVRLSVIAAGLLIVALTSVFSLILMLVWPLVPVAPVVGLVIAIGGGWK